MPLDKEAELSIGPFHGLGDAVFASGDNFQISAKVFDGLVMVGIDVCLVGAEDFSQRAFRVNFYLMISPVFYNSAYLRGYVLDKRAAVSRQPAITILVCFRNYNAVWSLF
jgi:hypothetical protein